MVTVVRRDDHAIGIETGGITQNVCYPTEQGCSGAYSWHADEMVVL